MEPAEGTRGARFGAAAPLQAARDFAASPEGREVAASGPLDWILLGLATVAVVVAVYLCIRYLLRPGEDSEDHIKREILREEIEREPSS